MEQVVSLPQFKRGIGGKVEGPLGVSKAAGEACPYQPRCHAGTLHLQPADYICLLLMIMSPYLSSDNRLRQ